MISELQHIFGSRTKALEMLYLLEGLKPMVRQGFYPKELPAVERFCSERGLFLERSPSKVLLSDHGAFSDEGTLVPAEHPSGMFFVYISKSQMAALQACLAETRQDHVTTGLLLGYPRCCAAFFAREAAKGNVKPVHPVASPWTNLTLREQDVVLLSHFPCRPDCGESVRMAKERLAMIGTYDKGLARRLYGWLNEKGTAQNE